MSKYRDNLLPLAGGVFLTDGGLETTLIFHEGVDLPEFAAFVLLKTAEGRARLRKYYSSYASLAKEREAGFILESPTWRANPDWGKKLGITLDKLDDYNRDAIGLLVEIRNEFEGPDNPVLISGCIGPRGDGYDPGTIMSIDEARRYHSIQISAFASTEADMVTALTMTNLNEAAGLALAAKHASMPVVISFTVETDGRLPSGQSIKDAIEGVDEATDNASAYYMINCAHPVHFAAYLDDEQDWGKRIRGIRANASTMSHEELNCSTKLDDGDPVDLGARYAKLLERFPHINVLGGCCGTDTRHVEKIYSTCVNGR